MSETKHTPIPWRVIPDTLGSIEDKNGLCVAQTQQTKPVRSAEDHAERLANAEIIVKSVNAHEALVEACRKSLKNGCSCHSSIMPNWHAEKCHILDVKAALRLAESTAPEVRDGEDV
jgi:hypothetical protein